MSDCLFCKIVKRDVPAEIIFENDELLAFRDISPVAPSHVLLIPKLHIPTLNDLNESHTELMGKMMIAAKEIAVTEGISEAGYRTVFNCNQAAGQVVFHIHMHIIGDRNLAWPPG